MSIVCLAFVTRRALDRISATLDAIERIRADNGSEPDPSTSMRPRRIRRGNRAPETPVVLHTWVPERERSHGLDRAFLVRA